MVDRRAFPKEIREILKNSQRSEEIHAGLWLDKYITDQSRDDTQSRRTFVEEVSTLSVPEAYKAFYTRWQKALDDYGARRREAIVQGRMSVGLGAESVLETSICLHRTYGVPYIPGSALKGLAASYTRLYLDEDERWKKEGAYYKVIFGNTDEAGYITFFDALYVPPARGHERQVLYPDIITVHHAEYYQGKQGAAPLDSDNPTPIPFLSATGTYLVALAAPPDMPQPEAWINITFSILEKALAELGIGAKTSSGYGRMKLKPPPAKPVDPETKKAKGYIHELEALKDIAGQIPGYSQKWQQLKSEEAQMLLAKAIVEKVRNAGREKMTVNKAWYRELRAFLGES